MSSLRASASPILLLEDEAFIGIEMQLSLESEGFRRVVHCSTQRQALTWLDENVPRAALLDVNLGRNERSFDVARRLKEMDCPFAFLTGYTDAARVIPPDLMEERRITKPFSIRSLADLLDEMIENSL